MSDEIDWHLIVRYLNHTCSAEERAAVLAWASSSADRYAELEGARRVWEASGGPLGSWDVTEGWRSVSERIGSGELVPSLAAIEQVRDGGSGRVDWKRWSTRMAARGHSFSLTRLAITASAACLLALAGDLAVTALRAMRGTEYITRSGERLTVSLADGTVITLAPASRLRIPRHYAQPARRAELEGEAFFRVVHDAAHPFQVIASGVSAADLGTAFDVRAFPRDSVVAVAVEEGRVAVDRPETRFAAATMLGAGDVATIPARGSVIRSRPSDLTSYTGWTHGTLAFHNASLQSVLLAFGRWYDVDVSVADSALLNRFVTGTWSSEPVSQALDELADVLHASAVRHGRTVILWPLASPSSHRPEA